MRWLLVKCQWLVRCGEVSVRRQQAVEDTNDPVFIVTSTIGTQAHEPIQMQEDAGAELDRFPHWDKQLANTTLD